MFAMSNPGPLVVEEVSASAAHGLLIAGLTLAVLCLVGLHYGMSKGRSVLAALSGIGVVVAAGGIATGGVLHSSADSDHQAKQRAQHTSDVAEWLDDRYNITVSDANVTSLIDGHELAVSLAPGDLSAIKIIDRLDDTIQVKVVDGPVLEPVN